jgi:hypothetical protein
MPRACRYRRVRSCWRAFVGCFITPPRAYHQASDAAGARPIILTARNMKSRHPWKGAKKHGRQNSLQFTIHNTSPDGGKLLVAVACGMNLVKSPEGSRGV